MPQRDMRGPNRTVATWNSMAEISEEDIENAKIAGRKRPRDELKNLADATEYTRDPRSS